MTIFTTIRQHSRLVLAASAVFVAGGIGGVSIALHSEVTGASTTRPPVNVAPISVTNSDPSAPLNYWTPERMRSAIPDTPPALPTGGSLPAPAGPPLPDGPPQWIDPASPAAAPTP